MGFDDYEWADIEDDDEEIYEHCHLVHETKKAWLVKRLGRQAWFPKSQCTLYIDEKMLVAPGWLDPEWTPVNK